MCIRDSFLAAAVPPPGQFRYDARTRGPAFVLSAIGPTTDATAAMPLSSTFKLFVGPKLQRQLQSVGNDLERTVDYGKICLLYTSDAADERSSVDLGGRRII